MGIYLNSKTPLQLFRDEASATYYVDKSQMLQELIPFVDSSSEMFLQENSRYGTGNRYICVTRPRRFGKTLMATMIASFFGKGEDSQAVFEKLKVGTDKRFKAHINRHNVIYISFNQMPDECSSYGQYISRIKRILRNDLKKAYPNVEISDDDAVWDILTQIYETQDDARFIFVVPNSICSVSIPWQQKKNIRSILVFRTQRWISSLKGT